MQVRVQQDVAPFAPVVQSSHSLESVTGPSTFYIYSQSTYVLKSTKMLIIFFRSLKTEVRNKKAAPPRSRNKCCLLASPFCLSLTKLTSTKN
jgi:hypothetical protein